MEDLERDLAGHFTSLTLSGFKRFAEPARFDLAPITLLLGGNSTGKSSVIQSLLALKQSFLRSPDGFMSLLVDGDDLRLGSFSNVQSGHDRQVEVGFDLRWGPEHGIALRYGDRTGNEGNRGPMRPTGKDLWDRYRDPEPVILRRHDL